MQTKLKIFQELFVRYLADKSFVAGKAENKHKKTLQYKDVGKFVVSCTNPYRTDHPQRISFPGRIISNSYQT